MTPRWCWYLSLFVILAMVAGIAQALAGVRIAGDPELFSEAVQIEFADMNQTFGEFGCERQVFQNPPSLHEIVKKYGEPDRSEEIDVVVGVGTDEQRATLIFSYYGDIGFGVRPDDSNQMVIRIKRREE